jgi:apolipoprotein N-acyltransferase
MPAADRKRPAARRRGRWADAGALAAGLALPLAFAPFSLYPVAVLSPAVLFAVWRCAAPGRAAWRGFLYGAGAFSVGVSWVYVSLHEFGNMPAALAGVTVGLFVGLLALFPALAGWAQARLCPAGSPVCAVLAQPAAWVLCEWMRGWAFTGFPWLSLGYSQVASPLAGLAPLAGVHGVGLAVAVTAAALAAAVGTPRRTAAAMLLVAGAVWALGAAAGTAQWTRPDGPALRAALVQGNVALERKWRAEERGTIIEHYLSLSEDVAGADVILWPEAAIPGFLHDLGEPFWERLRRLTGQGSTVMFGALERDLDAPGKPYYNVVVAVDAGGRHLYRKRHLVPFGEYLPLSGLFGWLLDYLSIPMSDFAAWSGVQGPLPAGAVRVGVSICYEDAFGAEARRVLPGASVLANFSEDAWFGDSLGPRQRLDMARMRALESGRPALRVANTGISAAFDAGGREIARTRQFVVDVLPVSVQPRQGATPYVRTGDAPVLGVALALAGLGGWRARRVEKRAGIASR